MPVLKKRSFSIAGHRTSIALEPEFWKALEEQAYAERLALVGLVARVDSSRGERPLASALRVYVLMRTVAQSTGPL